MFFILLFFPQVKVLVLVLSLLFIAFQVPAKTLSADWSEVAAASA